MEKAIAIQPSEFHKELVDLLVEAYLAIATIECVFVSSCHLDNEAVKLDRPPVPLANEKLVYDFPIDFDLSRRNFRPFQF
jgi:hypothetical protein